MNSHAGRARGEERRVATDASFWGMVLFLVSEAALFGTLIAAYHYLRVDAPAWPPEGVENPKLLVPAVNTALLLASSAAIVWAERGIRRGRRGPLLAGLGTTVVLAVAFLGLQGYEYARSTFGPGDHVYGSSFFALTGLHGLHVASGVLMLSATFVWGLLGRFDASRHRIVSNVGLYWHFVDAVWVLLIVPTVYLSPYWS